MGDLRRPPLRAPPHPPPGYFSPFPGSSPSHPAPSFLVSTLYRRRNARLRARALLRLTSLPAPSSLAPPAYRRRYARLRTRGAFALDFAPRSFLSRASRLPPALRAAADSGRFCARLKG